MSNYGSPVVPGFLDPYMEYAITLGHLLAGISNFLMEICFLEGKSSKNCFKLDIGLCPESK